MDREVRQCLRKVAEPKPTGHLRYQIVKPLLILADGPQRGSCPTARLNGARVRTSVAALS